MNVRIDHLKLIASSLRGRLLGVGEQCDRIRQQRDLLSTQIAQLEASATARLVVPDLAAQRRDLARLESQVRALDAEAAELTQRWKNAARLVEKCDRWLRVHPPSATPDSEAA